MHINHHAFACTGGPAHPLSTRWSSMAGGGAPAKSAMGGGGSASSPAFLFPLPHEYEQALQRKLGMTNDMRTKFKQAG